MTLPLQEPPGMCAKREKPKKGSASECPLSGSPDLLKVP